MRRDGKGRAGKFARQVVFCEEFSHQPGNKLASPRYLRTVLRIVAVLLLPLTVCSPVALQGKGERQVLLFALLIISWPWPREKERQTNQSCHRQGGFQGCCCRPWVRIRRQATWAHSHSHSHSLLTHSLITQSLTLTCNPNSSALLLQAFGPSQPDCPGHVSCMPRSHRIR